MALRFRVYCVKTTLLEFAIPYWKMADTKTVDTLRDFPLKPVDFKAYSNSLANPQKWLKNRKKERTGEERREQRENITVAALAFVAPLKIFGENFAPTSAVDHNFLREVQTVITEKYCQEVLAEYPEYITKEQMYRICHISKKTCQFLLESGLVPNMDSGKKTRRFKIKTTDVLQYLRGRDDYPELYKAPDGFYKSEGCKKAPSLGRVFKKHDLVVMRQYYEEHLSSYPDVMSIEQIAEFTGYCKTSVSEASLRAAGFAFDGEAGGKQWTGQRRRDYYVAPEQIKHRWIKERT